jgi:hypothetical protein
MGSKSVVFDNVVGSLPNGKMLKIKTHNEPLPKMKTKDIKRQNSP